MTVITREFLSLFDVPVARYTSYPTADRFVETFGEADHINAWINRQSGSVSKQSPPSLYVHIPFCESFCDYCACNKIITQHKAQATTYVHDLSQEVSLHTRHLGRGQAVSQLHLGGGTPTFLNNAHLRQRMAMLREHFVFALGGEYSVEVDPRTVDENRLVVLAGLGFNRLSFGVQDVDPDVQKEVHRIQPADQVFQLVDATHRQGFESVNVDLMDGLPLQTSAAFDRTLSQVNPLRPDLIALYAYTHLFECFKFQRRIHAHEPPSAAAKVALLSRSLDAVTDAGDVYMSMDHFTLPHDSLAVAKRQGHLQYEAINLVWLMDFKTLFAQEMNQLEDMQSQGLLQLNDGGILVTDMGWFLCAAWSWCLTVMCKKTEIAAAFSKSFEV